MDEIQANRPIIRKVMEGHAKVTSAVSADQKVSAAPGCKRRRRTTKPQRRRKIAERPKAIGRAASPEGSRGPPGAMVRSTGRFKAGVEAATSVAATAPKPASPPAQAPPLRQAESPASVAIRRTASSVGSRSGKEIRREIAERTMSTTSARTGPPSHAGAAAAAARDPAGEADGRSDRRP